MSKLKEFLEVEIAEIESDERHHYPSANVFSNAPLALIQLDMSSRLNTLKQVEKIIKEMETVDHD